MTGLPPNSGSQGETAELRLAKREVEREAAELGSAERAPKLGLAE